MRVGNLSGYGELLKAALLSFSVVSLGTLEFIKNAFPYEWVFLVPKTTVVYTIVLVQVLPALALLLSDRIIAARDKSGRTLRAYRSVLFVVALVLILRQLQLYWGPANEFTDSVNSSSVVLQVLVHLMFLAAIVGLAIGLFRGLVLFFLFMSPVAIAMTFILPSQVPTGGSLPETYGQEVVTGAQSGSGPAVFIVIFDGLAYDLLLEDGKPDAERFPNFATLAGDGVWFTNATSSYFWTMDSLPTIIDPATRLAEQFDIRLYIQSWGVEKLYIRECGKVYTCRGIRYLTERKQPLVAANIALRSFYQATPGPVETLISGPMGLLVDQLGSAYPASDSRGFHTLTKKQFDLFLDDIEGREALGRIHVLHTNLPHHPLIFNEKGKAISTVSSGSDIIEGQITDMGRYRKQIIFADLLLGRLIDKVKEEGIYDNSVIIVTSDHGLRDPMLFKPKPIDVTDRIAQVPLVIHAPGLDSGISDVDYQHIDFAATLNDVLGLPPPEGTEGVSAFSQGRPQRDKVFQNGRWVYTYSREDGSWRLEE